MPVDDRFVSLSAVRLRVREWSRDGPPIILVHGLASNAHIWGAVAPRLADRFRVVAIDQRGHGLSDKPDEGYGFSHVVGDLRELIAALGIEAPILVGHSWGGNVVLEYAATYPRAVAGLVLVDGGFIELAAELGMTWGRTARELAPPDLTALTLDELRERMRAGPAGDYWNEAAEATLRGSFDIGSDGRVRPRLSRANHLTILRALWEQRPSTLAGRVACPTLIVPARRSGGTEREVSWQAARERQIDRLAAVLPRARVQWMEETVHDVPLQRPRELADAVATFAVELDMTESKLPRRGL